MIKAMLILFLVSVQALAGLPPTTSKVTGDSNGVTTFKYLFPNFTGTHTGTTLSLGVNSIAGGGTGQITAQAAIDALLPSQTSNSGKVLTTNGTTSSWGTAATGTVTSVAITGTNQIGIASGSPVTTSGTIVLSTNFPGVIFPFAGTTCPTGSVAADGSSLLRSGTYAALFTAISTTWGSADGTHFNVPDLRGAFLRGTGTNGTYKMADTSTFFVGPSVGGEQDDQLQSHLHTAPTYGNGANAANVASALTSFFSTNSTSAPIVDGSNGTPRVGKETRPFNRGVLYCIWY